MSRLPAHVLVGALLRRANDGGGMGMVRARGDAQAGGILVLAESDGIRLLERGLGPDGTPAIIDSTPQGGIEGDWEGYWRRRRSRDPDLWVIELTSPEAERFVAETLLDD